MRDSLSVKEYLRAHGVDNAVDLSFDELQEKYEQTVREGISHYHKLLNEDNPELESPLNDEEKKGIIETLKGLKTTDEVYEALYEFMHTYQPADLMAFMAELSMPVPYGLLQRILSIIHSRLQDEMLDSIKKALGVIPAQERETLLAHYESMRNNTAKLSIVYNRLNSPSTLSYIQATAETKLNIIESFLTKDMEREYKPFYDNSKEKTTLIENILNISGIYSKAELFNMTIAELSENYDEIMIQTRQKERIEKLIRKYIEIFEEFATLPDSEFNSYCKEMAEVLDENAISEVIEHFSHKNHFISSKIRGIIYGPEISKQTLKDTM